MNNSKTPYQGQLQYMPSETISFVSLDTGYWIRRVSEEQHNLSSGKYNKSNINIQLNEDFRRTNLRQLHLVTLACLIQSIKQNGFTGRLQAHQDVISFLRDDLHLNEYFSSQIAHIKSESNYNLNLWKVLPEHALMYSQHVADYLKRHYFANKDLSGLKTVLDELYANIADHSDSQGLAYSFIKYDQEKQTIRIAFCDFGIGIKASLKKSGLKLDNGYVYAATTKGVSSRSNTHNRGFGLDTVVSSVCGTGNVIRILSGSELFVSYGDGKNQRTWIIDFDFRGTLIYFDLPVNSFEEADYVDEFEL